MEIITFDKLPEAVSLLLEKVTRIENLLNGPPLQQPEQDEPLNIKRAAKFLDLAVPTVYSKVSRKEIPVNKQGKRLYFYKSELEEWIRQGRKRTFNELRENIVLPRRTYSSRRKPNK
jgi:excisionase family DNA binding protein